MEGSVFKYEYSLDFEAQILGKIPPLNPNNLQDQDGQRVERRREGTGVRRPRALAMLFSSLAYSHVRSFD